MKSRNKDRKPHENIIGKIIYGFLLFMPLLAIGVTCAYAIFNKNAYQSYYGETINEVNAENNLSKIETNYKYTFEASIIPTSQMTSTVIYVNGLYNLVNVTSTTHFYQNSENIVAFSIYYNSNRASYSLRYLLENDSTTYYTAIYDNNYLYNIKFEFEPLANYDITNIDLKQYIYKLIYNDNSFVSEVFYYSIDKVQQSPLFNWAEDSAIYTGITATCNTLNITTPFIPLLMTYWLIISVIYILYDIILVILHIFHKKIHQLEDSF